MTDRTGEKLKIHSVVEDAENGSSEFSPTEMQPYEVAEALESDLVAGLNKKNVKSLRKRFGANIRESLVSLSFGQSLKNQIKGLTGIFLLLSSLIMFVFDSRPIYIVGAVVVILIMLTNAVCEFLSARMLRVPRKYTSLQATVIRDGEEEIIDSVNLVPGDVILLSEGSMVPADARLIECGSMTVLETPLSKNPESVEKDPYYIAKNGAEAVCTNMVYDGSIIVSGYGTAMVCYIGASTLRRTQKTQEKDYLPPLLKYVSSYCRLISVAAIIGCFALIVAGVAAGADITAVYITAVAAAAASLSDSAISFASISFGSGIKKMSASGVVVKNLGCISKMSCVNSVMCGKNLAFPPDKTHLKGFFGSDGASISDGLRANEALSLAEALIACSELKINRKKRFESFEGGPCETAAAEYLHEAGVDVSRIFNEYFRIDTDKSLGGETVRVITLHKGKNTVIIKGAPENILSRCAGYTIDGRDFKLSDYTRRRILNSAQTEARDNTALVAIATGETESQSLMVADVEKRMIFKGFITFHASMEAGVASSVFSCVSAGIEAVVSSTDSYYTACTTARDAGIIDTEEQVVTAEQFRSTERGLLIANCPSYKLFLNLSDPEWLDVMRFRQDDGKTVAVTAERLSELRLMKEADITMVPVDSQDTLKQTSDILLKKSGFDVISSGIKNAFMICGRIKAVVEYLAVGCASLFSAMLLSLVYDASLPLRYSDIIFGGLLFNLIIAASVVFSADSRNIARLGRQGEINGVHPHDFIRPLLFAFGSGMCLFLCHIVTGSYECALMSYTLMLFIYACVGIGDGSLFYGKSFGSPALFIGGGVTIGLMLALLFIPPLSSGLGYINPGIRNVSFALLTAIGYCLISQIICFVFALKNKKKK